MREVDVGGMQERVWTQRGIEMERRRRQEWERSMLLALGALVGLLLVVALVVGVVGRVVEAVAGHTEVPRLREGYGGGEQGRCMVENWRRGRYGSELADWE